MADSLHFDHVANPMTDDHRAGFDHAAGPEGIDLSGFDRADGKLVIPAGFYICRIERGELTTTKAGKPAYRLRFTTVEPFEYAGFTLWRWYVVDPADRAGCNRAKSALSRLGLVSGADLEAARLDALRLARFLIARYGILAPGIGVWFSGGKGLHIALGC